MRTAGFFAAASATFPARRLLRGLPRRRHVPRALPVPGFLPDGPGPQNKIRSAMVRRLAEGRNPAWLTATAAGRRGPAPSDPVFPLALDRARRRAFHPVQGRRHRFVSVVCHADGGVRAHLSPREERGSAPDGRVAPDPGGSSGIGAAIVEKLAKQNVNVVIVALDDELLDDFHAKMTSRFVLNRPAGTPRVFFFPRWLKGEGSATKQILFDHNICGVRRYPSVSFRKAPVDLSKPDTVLSAIRLLTDDIPVNLLFNNAGFITTGLFSSVPLERNIGNFHCNATSAIPLTHHFVSRMIERGQSGLVTFTGSGAGFIPCPMSSIYGATKVFLNSFAASLAVELAPEGIDVVCINPSPVESRFYENAGKLEALKLFRKTAVQPSIVADALFASAGRVIIRDLGYFSVCSRLFLKALDWNLVAEIFKVAVPKNGDFIRMRMAKQ
ncbi:MAG: hypothetical protein BJ554DRAFT_4845 [Olpidium bornovanus]|uniref:SDR family NAD(P)-dependent oxidoreductase n=1 Tax=Olpidium bornovanus TaxID=278681 RepID=A0A8H8A049_9FUNG|nr:MAG: hypothetical protein BJ554DRAFT_4845 [Olpidium bornovanus]